MNNSRCLRLVRLLHLGCCARSHTHSRTAARQPAQPALRAPALPCRQFVARTAHTHASPLQIQPVLFRPTFVFVALYSLAKHRAPPFFVAFVQTKREARPTQREKQRGLMCKAQLARARVHKARPREPRESSPCLLSSCGRPAHFRPPRFALLFLSAVAAGRGHSAERRERPTQPRHLSAAKSASSVRVRACDKCQS